MPPISQASRWVAFFPSILIRSPNVFSLVKSFLVEPKKVSGREVYGRGDGLSSPGCSPHNTACGAGRGQAVAPPIHRGVPHHYRCWLLKIIIGRGYATGMVRPPDKSGNYDKLCRSCS
jgi:hypothetical protein